MKINFLSFKRICLIVALLLSLAIVLSACKVKIKKKSNTTGEKDSSLDIVEENDGDISDFAEEFYSEYNSHVLDDIKPIPSVPFVPDKDDDDEYEYEDEDDEIYHYEEPSSYYPPTTSHYHPPYDITTPTNKDSVHILMWRKYTPTEQKLINDYSQKYGIKIETTVTTENEYEIKLVSMISGKNSPDIVAFSSNQFPGLVTKSLQPLDVKYFDLNGDYWNKSYLNSYKINNSYFGVAIPGAFQCEQNNYVTYYNPAVLKLCGIRTMPYDLYIQGKWNWDEQAKIARQIKNSGKGISGISLQSGDLFMHTAGADFASYNGKQFTNNLGSVQSGSLLSKAWQHMATLKAEEVAVAWDRNQFLQGKLGIISGISFGLLKESNWFDNVSGGYQNLQAVPMAGPAGSTAYTPVRPIVWGVPKGAKNPSGAASFLRYFLDMSNCNLSSIFYNKQFETVYNKIASSSTKKSVMVGWGVSNYVTRGMYESICSQLTASQPGNVTTLLNHNKGNVQTGINRANKDLSRIK